MFWLLTMSSRSLNLVGTRREDQSLVDGPLFWLGQSLAMTLKEWILRTWMITVDLHIRLHRLLSSSILLCRFCRQLTSGLRKSCCNGLFKIIYQDFSNSFSLCPILFKILFNKFQSFSYFPSTVLWKSGRSWDTEIYNKPSETALGSTGCFIIIVLSFLA